MRADVERLHAQLERHRPHGEREERSLDETLRQLVALSRPLDEHADPTHVTSSAIVLGADGRVVLHRHKRLGLWLQPGGHVDPGESCEQAALREVLEETGVVGRLEEDATPLHVDVHDGPRGHVHLDIRWLVHAASGADLTPELGESQAVRWLEPDEAIAMTDVAAALAIEAAVRRVDAG